MTTERVGTSSQQAREEQRAHRWTSGGPRMSDAVLACEEELRQAQLSGDVVALERLLDDALVFTSLDGTVVGKADDLALHRSGRLRITRMDPGERRVLRLGDVAVVVRMEAAAVIDGAEVAGPL